MADEKPPPDAGGGGEAAGTAADIAPFRGSKRRLLRRVLEARLKAASNSPARAELELLLAAPKQSRSEKRKILSTLLADDARSVRDALDYVKASKLDEGRMDQGAQIVINIGVPALVKPAAVKPPPIDVAAVPAATNGKPHP